MSKRHPSKPKPSRDTRSRKISQVLGRLEIEHIIPTAKGGMDEGVLSN